MRALGLRVCSLGLLAHLACLPADPYRPEYHFVIPEGYAMPFDPNGAIFWQRRYHLFYIYQQGAGNCIFTGSDKHLDTWKKLPSNPYLNETGRRSATRRPWLPPHPTQRSEGPSQA